MAAWVRRGGRSTGNHTVVARRLRRPARMTVVAGDLQLTGLISQPFKGNL